MADHPAYIELKGICKSFGPVVANHNINLSVEKGEIHALLGENGSGKSTLMNMLSGIYSPDAGEIYLDGKAVSFPSRRRPSARASAWYISTSNWWMCSLQRRIL